jgi:hypothetical protein
MKTKRETIFIRLSNGQWLQATGNRRRLSKIVTFMTNNFGVDGWQIGANDFAFMYKLDPATIPSLT